MLRRLLRLSVAAAEERHRETGPDAPQRAAGRDGVQMTPSPRCKPALADPGPVRLANPIDPPEYPRPDAKRDPTLPAGFDRQPEARPGRTLPAGVEPLLSIDDLAALLSCSRRLVERMRAAGKIPRAEIKIGKMPRWSAETIRRWIGEGGRP